MTGYKVETLVRRIACLADGWKDGRLSIKRVTRLDRPQAAMWLKPVTERWLLVASSDNYISRLSCFDASLAFSSSPEPLAECYFEGLIKTACAEVQDDHIIVSIGAGHP
jgi:hypothetical protein